MIDFVNRTGKNIGELQKSQLARFFEINDKRIKYMQDIHPKMLDCLYLGAVCIANDVNKEDLKGLIDLKKRITDKEE